MICKDYCWFLDPDTKVINITGYASVILEKKPALISRTVRVKTAASVNLAPWMDWKTDKQNPFDGCSVANNSPSWWMYYNKVKHNRTGSDSENKSFLNSQTKVIRLSKGVRHHKKTDGGFYVFWVDKRWWLLFAGIVVFIFCGL